MNPAPVTMEKGDAGEPDQDPELIEAPAALEHEGDPTEQDDDRRRHEDAHPDPLRLSGEGGHANGIA
jgi:hypothetical protein